MPYVMSELRPEIAEAVDRLHEVIQVEAQKTGDGDDAGLTNYAITRLLINQWGMEPKYKRINKVMGVLECVKHEFYRAVAVPYEDKKRKENGPVLRNIPR